MTDDITPQTQQPPPKKDEKKPTSGNSRGGPKKNVHNSRPSAGGAASAQNGPRPSSRTGNKKSTSSITAAVESGSDTTSRKGSDAGKKPEPRNKPQGGAAARPAAHRKSQGSASQGARNNSISSANKQSTSPPPPASKESSDALSSLQSLIADLKTTSPVQPSVPNTFAMSVQQGLSSTLPPNAPVFQPGAAAYPGPNFADPKHRKAASLGASGLSSNFSSFSPHLGAMMEDAEDANGNASYEDGEVQENYYHQPGHQPRAQSQSFMAPRFAALAAQQEQADSVGPTGRPQLAPGFMFGARARNGPMGPPINEEDVGFQFPQQQQQHFQSEAPREHRKSDSGEITGIMAEQVSYSLVSIVTILTLFFHGRLLFRTKSKHCSNNSKRFTSNNLLLTRSYLIKLLDSPQLAALFIDEYKALYPWAPVVQSLAVNRTRWVNSEVWAA